MRTGAIAILGLLLGAIACTGPVTTSTSISTPTPLASPTSSPTAAATPTRTASTLEPNALLLRLTVYEFPTPVTIKETPEFTLYADGRVIYAVKLRPPNGGWSSYELHSAQLSADQITEVVSAALDEGGLRDARAVYNIPNAVDREWNYFEVHAEGVDKVVTAYGLSDDAAPDSADRARFATLRDRLLNFAAEVEAGQAATLGLFEPTAYDAFLHTGVVTEELPVSGEWPWPDLSVSDFGSVNGTVWRRLTRAQGEAVTGLGINEYLIAEAPDTEKYLIRIRPLLPDEAAEPGPVFE